MIKCLALRKRSRLTLQHDCMMLREIMFSDVWQIKGCREKDAWTKITNTLLKIQTPRFDVSSRAMRERVHHLLSKLKAKNREFLASA